jgi:hypothetical protein
MARRELLPAGLLVLVVASDVAGVQTLAFYCLLAAIPALVVAGLATLEDVVCHECAPSRRVTGLVQATALVLVVLGAALRAPLRVDGAVPRVSTSAVVAALALLALPLLLTVRPAKRRSSPGEAIPAEPEFAEAA